MEGREHPPMNKTFDPPKCTAHKMHSDHDEIEIEGMSNQRFAQFETHPIGRATP